VYLYSPPLPYPVRCTFCLSCFVYALLLFSFLLSMHPSFVRPFFVFVYLHSCLLSLFSNSCFLASRMNRFRVTVYALLFWSQMYPGSQSRSLVLLVRVLVSGSVLAIDIPHFLLLHFPRRALYQYFSSALSLSFTFVGFYSEIASVSLTLPFPSFTCFLKSKKRMYNSCTKAVPPLYDRMRMSYTLHLQMTQAIRRK